MKIYISAQSLKRNEIMQDVHRKSAVIVEHLLKLILMPDNPARNHWQGEIAGQLNHIRSMKGSNKYPSAKMLMQWLYYDSEDLICTKSSIRVDLNNILDDYGYEYDGDLDDLISDLQDVCYSYFSWLSEKLSEDGAVRNQEIYRKLDMLV